jgi:hypothetical protein
MPQNAQARMCRREVIKLHKIPLNTRVYQPIPNFPLSSYSSETLCSIEVSKGLERTGTNHVFYKLGKPEGEPAKAQLPTLGKPKGEPTEAPLPNHGKAEAPLPKHGKRLSIRAILHWANEYGKEPPM